MVNLIGITGPARHGKDTVGQMLLKHLPSTNRFAFADKIKEFLGECMQAGETMEQNKEGKLLFMTSRGALETAMFNSLHEGIMKYGIDVEDAVVKYLEILQRNHGDFYIMSDGRILLVSSWRKLFQVTGTEWGRQSLDERFWIDPWLPNGNTIITDVRGHGDSEEHKNVEAQAVLEKGGVVIKVLDPRKESPQIRSHASEAGIDVGYIDHVILNDGTLEDLEAKVVSFIKSFLMEKEHG